MPGPAIVTFEAGSYVAGLPSCQALPFWAFTVMGAFSTTNSHVAEPAPAPIVQPVPESAGTTSPAAGFAVAVTRYEPASTGLAGSFVHPPWPSDFSQEYSIVPR